MKQGGKYLVIVKYPYGIIISGSGFITMLTLTMRPIVWARDMDEENNRKLLEYFKDRQVLFMVTYWDRPGFLQFDARQ